MYVCNVCTQSYLFIPSIRPFIHPSVHAFFDWLIDWLVDAFILFILFVRSIDLFYLTPKVLNSLGLKYQTKNICVWNGHGPDLEVVNVSARQAALNRWAATDKRWNILFIYPFIRPSVHAFFIIIIIIIIITDIYMARIRKMQQKRNC